LDSDVDLEELAGLAKDMVGSQIASICRSAAMMAITESIHVRNKRSSANFAISARHFKKAIENVRQR
jgi:SpoVK/Ycf46/Vps4 family AAA+-type ATPase